MNETQGAVLRAIAETVVPRVERADDPHGFWALSGAELGAHEAVAEAIAQMPEQQRDGLGQLADGLARMGFLSASQRSREQLLRNLAALGPEAAAGAQALVGLSLFFAYSIPDPATGVNPLWAEFGYPGPGRAARAAAQGGRGARPRGRRGHLRGRRRGRRIGRRRRRDRGGARRGGPARDRARGRRPVRGGRLQRLRAVGVPEPLLARRPQPDRGHERVALRRRGLRRRHDHQLDQLPAHEALGARAVGARARPRGARRPRLRPPPRRRLGAPVGHRPLLGPERDADADEARAPTRSAGRSRRSRATSTRRATRPTAPASSASATAPAPSSRRRAPTSPTRVRAAPS